MRGRKKRIYKGFSGEYKIGLTDERIIRRYILLLSDTQDPEYLVRVMAYVFRTSVERVYEIVASTSDEELCHIAVLQKKWRKRQENSIGYIKKEWREDECVQGTD